jgi:hypothetical protein
MRRHITALLTLSAALVLAACGQDDMSRSFGLARDTSGGTARVPLLPLSVPPNIGDRPLRPGASAIPSSVSQQTNPDVAGASAGQQALLEAAGGDTDPGADIRQKIDDDARLVHPSPQFVTDLLNWIPPPGYATLFQSSQKSWWSRLF